MLHVSVIAPQDACDAAVEALEADPTTSNLVVVRGAAQSGTANLLLFDIARENANTAIDMLRALGIAESGSIRLSEPLAVISSDADRAEGSALGSPSDAVIWAQIEADARSNSRLSWSFAIFLVLACLIAGVGRYLDQPVLIIAAMVVGPEFAPIAALCVGLARRRGGLILPSMSTLFVGFALGAAVSWLVWSVVYAFGGITVEGATTGRLTEFIVRPDVWSFVIALLAGVAGVLSLTTAKSSALVGVFISITTVPAVGTIGLTLAVGAWDEALASLGQLGINLAGLIIAGTGTLAVQWLVWRLRHRTFRKPVSIVTRVTPRV
ncbi:DUF389 domain-containing protein [Okibacterium endophyticum]